MKILIVHRHYWPDTTPQATILRSIAKRWTEDGHDVTAFAGQPSYNDAAVQKLPRRDQLDGSEVRRARLLPETKANYKARAVNYGAFLLQAAAHVLRRRDYDLVVGLTTPPLLPALILRNAAQATGAAFLYHCLDIYPEVAIATDLMPAGKRSEVLRRLDSWSARRSDAVVVLSTDMKQLQIDRGVPADIIRVINNIDIEEFETTTEQLPAAFVADDDGFRVVFAGNLGRFQCLPTIIDAAHLLAGERVRFDFLGDGVSKDALMNQAGPLLDRSVFFHGRVSAIAARRAVETSDASIISLDRGVIRAAYPSKTVTYLKAGAIIIAMLEDDSELAELVLRHDIGVVVEPGDAAALASQILELSKTDAHQRQQMRQRALKAYDEDFDRESTLQAWSDVAVDLAKSPGTTKSPGATSQR